MEGYIVNYRGPYGQGRFADSSASASIEANLYVANGFEVDLAPSRDFNSYIASVFSQEAARAA